MSAVPRILIVGAAGQIGIELQSSFQGFGEIVAADRETVDLSDPDATRSVVRSVNPDIVLNAAAYTAVDRAETEPELAMAINARAPGILAEEAFRCGALLVHYSTDYVFDGKNPAPWTEADTPNPLNVYGATKLAGEQAIARAGGRHLIFRTSWVYGPHGSNFLLTMLRLGNQRDHLSVVDDRHGSPTAASAVAKATYQIVSGVITGDFGAAENWAGLYHMTCSGSTTWCGFARAIFARAGTMLAGAPPIVSPIASADYPAAARRPHHSVLSNEKLKNTFGVQLPLWDAALDAVILELTAQG